LGACGDALEKVKIMKNIIINSFEFSNRNKSNVEGKMGNTSLRGCLRIIEEEPATEVKWGPKICAPMNTPFRITHPIFKNTTYILENIKFENLKKKATLLEYMLLRQNIIK